MIQLPIVVYVVISAGLIAWLLPFFLTGWSKKTPTQRDARWRWGLVLELSAYPVLMLGVLRGDGAALPEWRVALAIAFFALASLLSWTSARALRQFLRFEAALDVDHQLVRSGPYRVVRHPIYASMLCFLLGLGALVARPVPFAVALVLFIAGTEVRVQVEDRLLAGRFGEEFKEYCRTTRAYVPLLR